MMNAPQQSQGTVWVVDDSATEAARVSRLLGKELQVETFADGAVMLERLAGPVPDLVLLDWQMPGMSGVEVCRFLRERFDQVALPILMLSVRGGRSDFSEGLTAGANDYVAKPWDEAELLARVRTLVRVKQQAEALRLREEWVAATLRSIHDGVITSNARGEVTSVNGAAEQLTGWQEQEALGRPFADIFVMVPEGLVRKNGDPVQIEHSFAPIGAGGRHGTVVSFRDVGPSHRAAAESKSRADFEEKLLGMVSHDLRNPLNIIHLGSTRLLQSELDDKTQKIAVRIQNACVRATRLVGDLLDFTQARLGAGIRIRPEAVDLHLLAAQAVEEVQLAFPDGQIELHHDGDGRGSWDPDRVSQVLANLISNAIKYGAKDKPVRVSSRGEGDGVSVEVSNTGKPIDRAILPVLFEPMTRGLAESADKSVGLGLYIVKHLVDAHGGRVSVQSEPGGTTFRCWLPRQRTSRIGQL